MRRMSWVIVWVGFSLIFLAFGVSSAADKPIPGEPKAPMEPSASAQQAAGNLGSEQPEVQWIWGEVVSVDMVKNQIQVKYLDYEADMEKEMTISVDEKTTYENIKSLSELKAQDTVSIDYALTLDGKYLAKNISVEKPEAATPQPETSNLGQVAAPAMPQANDTAVTEEAPPAPVSEKPEGE